MKKRFAKPIFVLCLCLAALFVYTTCEIGLGAAVDTQPPKLSITYPPADSVIRDSFILAGNATDETSVARVTVSLRDTLYPSRSTLPDYEASINNKAGKWSVLLNTKTADTYPIPDGKYEVTVTAYDSAGKTTTTRIVYTIDNTPPVLILQNPHTKVGDAEISAFGEKLTVSGLVWDSNLIENLTFKAIAEGADVSTAKEASISVSQNMYSVVSSFTDGPNELYQQIYGTDKYAEEKNYRSSIEVYDNAREFKTPDLSGGMGQGNRSDGYYLYKEIGQIVNAKNLYRILSGIYAYNEETRLFDSAKEAEAQTILDALSGKKLATRDANAADVFGGSFTLDANSSPSWKLNMFQDLKKNGSDFFETTNSITWSGGRLQIPVRPSINVGTNALVADSIGLYAYECDENAKKIEPENKITLFEPLIDQNGNFLYSDDELESKRNERDKEMAVEDMATGPGLFLKVSIEKSGISSGKSYLLELVGHDIQNKTIVCENNKAFGFKVVSSVVPPTLLIQQPLSDTLYIRKDNPEVHFSGLSFSPAGNIKKLTISSSPPFIKENFWGEWERSIDFSNDAHYPQDKTGTYTFMFTATDDNGLSAERQKTIVYDVSAPQVVINRISPQVTTFNDDGSIIQADNVNGSIKVSGVISEDEQLDRVTYILKQDSTATAPERIETTNFSFLIDTTHFTDDKDLTIEITAKDRAGNETITSQTVHINQASDLPIIRLNADTSVISNEGVTGDKKNLFSKDMALLKGPITDDDGLKSIQLKIDGSDVSYPAISGFPLSHNFEYDLKDLSAGIHTIEIIVTDKFDAQKTTGPFKVGLDGGVLSIEVSEPQQNSFYRGGSSMTVKGTILCASGAKPALAATGSGGTSSLQVNNLSGEQTYTWQDTLALTAASGIFTKKYTITDLYGRTASADFNFKVDNDRPQLGTDFTHTDPVFVNFDRNPIYRIAGTATDDGGSGLSKIKYRITEGANQIIGILDQADWDANWKEDALSGGNWVINANLATLSGTDDQAYTLHIAVSDTAGNFSDIKNTNIYVDRNDPQLTIEEPASSDLIFKEDFTFKVSVSDVNLLNFDVNDSNPNLAPVVFKIRGTSTTVFPNVSGGICSYTVPVDGLSSGEYTLVAIARDKSGRTTEQTRSFKADKTPPQIIYNESLKPDNSSVLTSNEPIIYGYITDDIGLQSAKFQFEKKVDAAFSAVGSIKDLPVISEAVSQAVAINMATELGANLDDGVWRLKIWAIDLVGRDSGVATSPEFKIDRTPPSLEISTIRYPSGSDTITLTPGAFVPPHVTLTVQGNASDENGLAKIIAQLLTETGTELDKKTIESPSTVQWSLAFKEDAFTLPGLYTIRIIAYDNSGRITEQERQVACDAEAPIISFIKPFAENSESNPALIGKITVSGKSEDLAMKMSYYSIGGILTPDAGNPGQQILSGGASNGVWMPLSNPYSWSFEFNSQDVLSYAVQQGASSKYDLQIHIKALDNSSNSSYNTLSICIDTDLDKPITQILVPDTEAILGGAFLVAGTARDNNFVHSVYMQLEVEGAVYEDAGPNKRQLKDFAGVTTAGGMNAAQGSDTDYFKYIGTDSSAWYKIDYTNGSWRSTLNKAKEFYKTELKKLSAQAGLSNDPTRLIVRVKSMDTKTTGSVDQSVFSEVQTITVILDETAPSIEEIDLPAQYSYVSGTIPIKYKMTDDVGIAAFEFSIAGVNKTTPYWFVSPDLVKEADNKTWTVNYSLDTTAILSDDFTVPVTITIKVTEISSSKPPKTTTLYRQVYVDKVAPEAKKLEDERLINISPSADRIVHEGKSLLPTMGTEVIFNGKAYDALSGVKQVILYFSKGEGAGQKLFTMGGTTGLGEGADIEGSTLHDVSIGGTSRKFPVASLADIQTGKTSDGLAQKYIVIDRAEYLNDTIGDQDGYKEDLKADGRWSVKLNSNLVPDGVYTVHYVIVDNAGMASYYEDFILVQNNPPRINSVGLYTDLNGDTNMTESEKTTVSLADFASSGFTVKNSKFKIVVNAEVPNGSPTYKLTYPVLSGTAQITNSTGIFELTDFAADNPLANYTIEVTDGISPPLSSGQKTVVVAVDNVDETLPVAKLHSLTVDDILIDAGKPLGHIEIDGKSLHDGTDPDVSGKISMRGRVSDDQRLTRVDLSIDGINKTILQSGADGLLVVPEALSATVTITSQSLTLAGHHVEWTYLWDTSNIADVVKNNVAIELTAYDARPTGTPPGNSHSALAEVDVVPYIQSVTTSLSESKISVVGFDRTARGKYPVRVGDTVELEGFNLAKGSAAADTVVTIGSAPPITTSSVNKEKISFAVPSVSSGPLVVTVNSIASINNSNDNTQTANQRTSVRNAQALSDDVELDIWQFKNAAQPRSGVAKYPTMKIGPAGEIGFSFANSIFHFSMAGRRSSETVNSTYYSHAKFINNVGGFEGNTFTWDAKGNTYGVAISLDTTDGHTTSLQFFSRWSSSGAGSQQNYANIDRARRLEPSTFPDPEKSNTVVTDIRRSRSPAMATWIPKVADAIGDTNPVFVHLAYFDNYYKKIRYRQGAVSTGNTTSPWLVYDNRIGWAEKTGSTYAFHFNEGALRDHWGAVAWDAVKRDPKDTPAREDVLGYGTDYRKRTHVLNMPTGAAPSEYVAIGVTSLNVPVIAWYDSGNRQLCLSYNTNTANQVWTTTPITGTSGSSESGGLYVQMAVDANDGIHLAYYTSDGGDLKYAYLSSYADSNPYICTVDAAGSVGRNCTIDVGRESTTGNWIPYISYRAAGNIKTRIRIAYPVEFDSSGRPKTGTDAYDQYTGAWECSVVPTANTAAEVEAGEECNKVNVGVHKTWNNGVLQSFASGSDVSQEDPGVDANTKVTANRVYGNGTKNPIVSYTVEQLGAIEMAQKR